MENGLFVLLLASEAAVIGLLIYGLTHKVAQIYRRRGDTDNHLLVA
jgi:hypothetical protein